MNLVNPQLMADECSVMASVRWLRDVGSWIP